MNVSEFERNKPRNTYREITIFEEELEACLNYGMNVMDTEYVLNKIRNIKNIFLSEE